MYLLKRLKEPSTWASLSAASAALASVPAFSAHALTASAVFAAIGILLKEQGSSDSNQMASAEAGAIHTASHVPEVLRIKRKLPMVSDR